MITIQIDGKTYKALDGFDVIKEDTIKMWKEIGLVEEVKKNKETEHFTVENITLPKGTTFEIKDGVKTINLPETSIIKKLREELEKKIQNYKELEESVASDWTAGDFYLKRTEAESILYFLTSLEKKEDREQQTKDITGMLDLCMNVKPQFFTTTDTADMTNPCNQKGNMSFTQFTPGQEEPEVKIRDVGDGFVAFDRKKESWTPTPNEEIEVSNDGKKWEKRVFQKLSGIKHQEYEDYHNKCWRFARPLQNDIEELPELKWEMKKDGKGELDVLKHIKLLTKTLNQVIRKLK